METNSQINLQTSHPLRLLLLRLWTHRERNLRLLARRKWKPKPLSQNLTLHEELRSRLNPPQTAEELFGSISEDEPADVDSGEDEYLQKLPAQEWKAEPVTKDLVQATQAWTGAKDEGETLAGIKPCCLRCKSDSHIEAQCIAAVVRQRIPSGEDNKPGESIRKKKSFKRFRRDLAQVVFEGKNTDNLWYVLETEGYSHLFACFL